MVKKHKEKNRKKNANNGSNGNHGYCYEVISNCPRCRGAMFHYSYRNYNIKGLDHLYQCLQCARIYIETISGFALFARHVKTIPPESVVINPYKNQRIIYFT